MSEADAVEVGRRASTGLAREAGVVKDDHHKPTLFRNLRRRLQTERTVYLASVFVVAFVMGSLVPLLEDLIVSVFELIETF